MGAHVANWREQLSKNTSKTRWIMFAFILLYMLIGLLIDFVIQYHMHQHIAVQAAYTAASSATDLSWQSVLLALLTLQAIPYATLILFAIALISILITIKYYDRLMLAGQQYILVDEKATDLIGKTLYNLVEEMKIASGLNYMPKIYIIEAEYLNAFASGYSERSAMIAITRGLLKKLNRSQTQAVIAHELSHIKHGDIKLTLMASVLSNLMLMAIDLLFYQLLFSGRARRSGRGGAPLQIVFLIVMILRIVLPILTVCLMLMLSRTREYMADAGCVKLQRDHLPLIQALKIIHAHHLEHEDRFTQQYQTTAHEAVRREAYIYSPFNLNSFKSQCAQDFFSTHPSIAKRLKALGAGDTKRL